MENVRHRIENAEHSRATSKQFIFHKIFKLLGAKTSGKRKKKKKIKYQTESIYQIDPEKLSKVEMNSKQNQIRVLGQRSIASSFIFRSSNPYATNFTSVPLSLSFLSF